MDLTEFVTETLVAIQKGVLAAINRMDDEHIVGTINPVWLAEGKIDWKDYTQPVEFDVAVTTTDKASGGGKGGIKVLGLAEFGGEGAKSLEHSMVNRIKFTIPIVPPMKRADRYFENVQTQS